MIPFEDHIAFRYAYESRFRAHWDRRERLTWWSYCDPRSSEIDSLPYDLLLAGRRLSFNLGGHFPNLSYPFSALDKGDLGACTKLRDCMHPAN